LYPENAKPTIKLDEFGICSGCRYHESRSELDIPWDEREKMLLFILEEAKDTARQRGNSHDCIIPVGGGKDSCYQVWLMKEKYGMNPLLVTYNHLFNTPAGNRNLRNLIEKSGCDLIRYSAGPDSVRKISRYMLKTVGDLNWHYHAGIRTLPFQLAVKYNIPLIVWGEHGFGELTGVVTLEDFVEFTKWTRKEHDMRGYEPHDLIGYEGITHHDIGPYIYPTDEEIDRVDVRGIFISNHVYWNGKAHAQLMIDEWGFSPVTYERERSFNLHSRLEDHANDIHDYLKYLKFGYGRATDDASMEIRHGRMTRDEGLELVRHYDSREPTSLGLYCDFLDITVDEFYRIVEPMRDAAIWQKDAKGVWHTKDAVYRHEAGDRENMACLPLSSDLTFSENNRHLYYNKDNPPVPTGDPDLDVAPKNFVML
jgi:N-acetyl sugar amidotransferase